MRGTICDSFFKCIEYQTSIHRQISEVYGDVMSDSMVGDEWRLFNEGRTNVHDEERTGRPSLVNDVLVQVEKKIHENRRFVIINTFSSNFPFSSS